MQFADGWSFNKGKLEAAIFGGDLFTSKPATKASKDNFVAKKEDVDLIVRVLSPSIDLSLTCNNTADTRA